MIHPHVRQFASRLAAAWHQRWLRAVELLRRDPAHDDAWLWQLQARILTFLLNRYGERSGIGDPQISHLPDPRISIERELGTPPRSREAIRVILDRIAQANCAFD